MNIIHKIQGYIQPVWTHMVQQMDKFFNGETFHFVKYVVVGVIYQLMLAFVQTWMYVQIFNVSQGYADLASYTLESLKKDVPAHNYVAYFMFVGMVSLILTLLKYKKDAIGTYASKSQKKIKSRLTVLSNLLKFSTMETIYIVAYKFIVMGSAIDWKVLLGVTLLTASLFVVELINEKLIKKLKTTFVGDMVYKFITEIVTSLNKFYAWFGDFSFIYFNAFVVWSIIVFVYSILYTIVDKIIKHNHGRIHGRILSGHEVPEGVTRRYISNVIFKNILVSAYSFIFGISALLLFGMDKGYWYLTNTYTFVFNFVIIISIMIVNIVYDFWKNHEENITSLRKKRYNWKMRKLAERKRRELKKSKRH